MRAQGLRGEPEARLTATGLLSLVAGASQEILSRFSSSVPVLSGRFQGCFVVVHTLLDYETCRAFRGLVPAESIAAT